MNSTREITTLWLRQMGKKYRRNTSKLCRSASAVPLAKAKRWDNLPNPLSLWGTPWEFLCRRCWQHPLPSTLGGASWWGSASSGNPKTQLLFGKWRPWTQHRALPPKSEASWPTEKCLQQEALHSFRISTNKCRHAETQNGNVAKCHLLMIMFNHVRTKTVMFIGCHMNAMFTHNSDHDSWWLRSPAKALMTLAEIW